MSAGCVDSQQLANTPSHINCEFHILQNLSWYSFYFVTHQTTL